MTMAFKGPSMGLIVGAGLSGGVAAGIRAFTTWDKWATLIGMGAAALVGFGLTMTGKKDLGYNILWAGLLTGAPRAVEDLVVGGGFSGTYSADRMSGLGQGVEVLGLTTASEQTYDGVANMGASFGAVPIAGVQ
jgi:hypothetical protein